MRADGTHMNKQANSSLSHKKILYIHKTGEGWGGAQQGVFNLINHFHAEFMQTIFVCNHGLLFKKIKALPVKTYYLPIGSVWLLPITLIFLAVIIFNEKPDVIHSNHRYPTLLAQQLRQLFHFKYKIVHTARNVFHDKIFSDLGDRVIAITETVRKNLLEQFHIPAKKIRVIYNGIEPMSESDNNSSSDPLLKMLAFSPKTIICSVGTLVKRKGHCYLIDALAQLPPSIQNQILVLIVGDGPLRPRLEAKVHKLGLSSLVKFSGFREDIFRILNDCNFNVVTSNQEGLCRVIIEGYLLAKPTIAFGLDYALESIQPQKSGLIVPLNDIAGLARAIQFYVEHPDIIEKHGQAGQQFITGKFSVTTMLDQYRLVYEELLDTNLKSKKWNG